MTSQIFQNIFLVTGLVLLSLGGWLRQKQETRKRGTRLLWLGFVLILMGLLWLSDVILDFFHGVFGR